MPQLPCGRAGSDRRVPLGAPAALSGLRTGDSALVELFERDSVAETGDASSSRRRLRVASAGRHLCPWTCHMQGELRGTRAGPGTQTVSERFHPNAPRP